MAQAPQTEVLVKDFSGLVDATDDTNLPSGSATVQTNLTCARPGELGPRPGYRVVKFEGEG